MTAETYIIKVFREGHLFIVYAWQDIHKAEYSYS